MRTWLFLLGGLIVWTIHFFALWTVGSVFLSVPVARVVVIAVTVACLMANGAILFVAARNRPGDGLEKWIRSLAISGAWLSVVAVVWQGLPALLTR